MQKKDAFEGEKLPELNLYLDDLVEIIEILKKEGCSKIEINTNNYLLDDIMELPKMGESVSSLGITSSSPYIHVALKPSFGFVMSMDSKEETRKLISVITVKLLKRKRLLNSYAIAVTNWLFLVWLITFTLIKTNFSVLLPGAALIILLTLWTYYKSLFIHNLIFTRNSYEGGYFQKNKTILLKDALFIVIGVLIAKAVDLAQLFFK